MANSYNTDINNRTYLGSTLPNGYVKSKDVAPCECEKSMPVRHKFTKMISDVPFNPAFAASTLRTTLNTKQEQTVYSEVAKLLNPEGRSNLNYLLKSGILLKNDSDNNTTVLDNLYKIATTERAEGLNAKSLVNDLVTTLAKPFVITQQFGDIPKDKQGKALTQYLTNKGENLSNVSARQKGLEAINLKYSSTCAAASLEYNFASKYPAEFARFTEALTSPAGEVKKQIHLEELADYALDAVWLLNAFEIPHEEKDFKTATLTFKPDKNALLRAQIQTTDKDPGERTPIDVLMQSTFMQVASQQTYDSLSDTRKGKFTEKTTGLIEFEKTFIESIVKDKNIISVTYQKLDDNGRLVGYETDMDTLKRQLTTALDMGENVILGYTQTDANNIVIGGHEITIVDYIKRPDGKYSFICNDTDDSQSNPIEYSEDFLLPKIHHAALPQSIVKNDVKVVDNWVEGLNNYKNLKAQVNNSQINLNNVA